MPIEFVCDHCQKLLKVGRRKIGAEITCPKCGGTQLVPDELDASVAVALRQAARSHPREDAVPEFVVYDDPPVAPRGGGYAASALAEPETQPTSVSGGASGLPRSYNLPRSSGAGSTRSSRAGIHRSRESLLLVSRRTLYIQAGLFVVLGGLAFLAGFLIGRGREPLPVAHAVNQMAAQPVEGVITYKTAAGVTMRDAGAVVLAIPEGKYPSRKWETTNLHPRQPPPADDSRVVLEIEELGGSYARSDADGNYLISLPRAGHYSLLFISRNARRASGVDVDPDDLDELRQLFAPPIGDLIGRSKYGFDRIELAGGQIAAHSHDFGVDGQK